MEFTTGTLIAIIVLIGVILVAAIRYFSQNQEKEEKIYDKIIVLSKEIALRIDQKGATTDGKFSIKPLSVADGRCPKGVECIRAGEVFVEFLVKSGDAEELVKMATPSTGKEGGLDEITFEGLRVKLVNVSPYPVSPKPEFPAETMVGVQVS